MQTFFLLNINISWHFQVPKPLIKQYSPLRPVLFIVPCLVWKSYSPSVEDPQPSSGQPKRHDIFSIQIIYVDHIFLGHDLHYLLRRHSIQGARDFISSTCLHVNYNISCHAQEIASTTCTCIMTMSYNKQVCMTIYCMHNTLCFANNIHVLSHTHNLLFHPHEI